MPGSDISRLSIAGQPKSDMASQLARDSANRVITHRVNQGEIDRSDVASLRREWKDIYKQEYYRIYAQLVINDQQSERIIYVPTENPSARKFYNKHAVAGFTKSNCFIHVKKGHITISKFNYPINGDLWLETKEAFLEIWPGPLDRCDDDLKLKTTSYIDTLWDHDSQRRLRYCSNDEQRRTIVKLLIELLHRNGSIDASSMTRLLLSEEHTDIQKDDGSRKPLETLQKYLLLGKRSDAIKYARSRKLWDHAQCLAFLDKYQPPNHANYMKDGLRLSDDSIVQLNDEFITSLDHATLNIVYRSLLNRILEKDDSKSCNIVKHPNVANNAYQFALLSANDCEMVYDQTNEIFRLVNAIKKATDTRFNESDRHLISLGLRTFDTPDPDELIAPSLGSFAQYENNYHSRTLIISNIDLLILNEIWEYSLNLARKTDKADKTDKTTNYNYIINLVPYKLVFASRLLDLGLYEMFEHYLISIINALNKSHIDIESHMDIRDQFYDWDTIVDSVHYLSGIWDIIRRNKYLVPDPKMPNPTTEGLGNGTDGSQINDVVPLKPMANEQHVELYSPPESQVNNSSGHNSYHEHTSMPHNFIHSYPPTIPEEVNFNPDPDPDSLEQQPDHLHHNQEQPIPEQFNQAQGQPVHGHFNQAQEQSVPVYYNQTSFEQQFVPDLSDQVQEGPVHDHVNSASERVKPNQEPQETNQPAPDRGTSANTSTGQSNDPQQAGLFSNLAVSVRSLLPKSNSKQMILPDDSSKAIVYDQTRGSWVDTTKPEGEDTMDLAEPPPIAPIKSPPNYSFAMKSAKSRYPKR